MVTEPLRIFVSHSHEDDRFCRVLVTALRQAGADVWYDEHNMASGRLGPTIERELRARPVFVVIISPAALRSHWVEDEARWAYNLLRKDPSRIIQPITAAPLEEDDIWLFLQDFKRIEAPNYRPYPTKEAIRRTLRALALPSTGQASAPTYRQLIGTADDLISRGEALQDQEQYAEALLLFEKATQLAPGSVDAWLRLGDALDDMERYEEALTAYDQVLALEPDNTRVWNDEASLLHRLGREEEALTAYDQVLALEPDKAWNWASRGFTLYNLGRHEEALAALDRALALNPKDAIAWSNKGATLATLNRGEEALAAFDQALALNPKSISTWRNKAITLRRLGRTTEAEAAERRAEELDE